MMFLADSGWRLITDRVMGGLSEGRLDLLAEDGRPHVRMTGIVRTANRGGFIQMRTDLPAPLPDGTRGVRLAVRGDGQECFVHLRTRDALRPWQFHQAGFDAPPRWNEVHLPLAAFAPRGGGPAGPPVPGAILSVAIAAYGREQSVRIDLREAGFF